ncbi:hypothetical protein CW749_01145 [Vibrio sp. vnigr-6D03]|uniref:DUF3147 family protein n=1 Tax=Vibrio penaeicida TaxID=104609 RepID=A0AAV5NTX4_9VIBR|nr:MULTISPECIES: DUF3147 family protein [Vibrio]PKF81276.1 hypothetical protein CW749_01145 [Vibrio sp. vnigr-6D03]RTZ21142.1 DUF3147 family protein [Vibrio penaeicida]GLQ74181.1 hypothetical protein GCM10007932_35420 [Vibrio penaeicida]
MAWIVTKFFITATIIVLVSELAKRSDKLGALLASLPLVTVLALIWLHFEGQPKEKLANHAFYTFWYVVATLPMFLAFPMLMQRFHFFVSLGIGIVITMVSFGIIVWIARTFGVDLL